jgi:hypothetical protein
MKSGLFGLLIMVVVFGMPSCPMQFARDNVEQVHNSLVGAGKLSLSQGRIAALDLPENIERAKQLLTLKGDTASTRFGSDLNVAGQKLNLAAIQLENTAPRGDRGRLHRLRSGDPFCPRCVHRLWTSQGRRGGRRNSTHSEVTVESPQVHPAWVRC